MYTGAMVIYLFFCTLFGHREVSLGMLWGLLAVSVGSALIQGICFSDWLIPLLLLLPAVLPKEPVILFARREQTWKHCMQIFWKSSGSRW